MLAQEMKKRSAKWWIGVALLSPVVLFILYNVVGLFIYLPAKAMIAKQRIYAADKSALLQACRQMLANRDS